VETLNKSIDFSVSYISLHLNFRFGSDYLPEAIGSNKLPERQINGSNYILSQQGDGVVVKHPTRAEWWRWLTVNEIKKIHAVPPSYYLGEEKSKTGAGEILGQGVIVSFFQKIISAASNFYSNGPTPTTLHTENSPSSPIRDLATPNSAMNQLRLAFT
jgi:hypothetical protein